MSLFPNIFFGIYDDMTSEHVPGLLKYDVCITEQVSSPQGPKIAGRHMAMIPISCNNMHTITKISTKKAIVFGMSSL